MAANKRHPGLVILLVSAFYCMVAGLAFTAFASWSHSQRGVFAWRLASFIVSLIAFVSHIAYERYLAGSRPLIAALRAAVAVALGALGLAVAANIHSVGVEGANHRLLAMALIIWPVMTGLPAFVVAWAVSAGLKVFRR